jgi:hypothetical protein
MIARMGGLTRHCPSLPRQKTVFRFKILGWRADRRAGALGPTLTAPAGSQRERGAGGRENATSVKGPFLMRYDGQKGQRGGTLAKTPKCAV